MDGYSSGFDDCSEGGTDSSREDEIYEPSSDSKRSNGALTDWTNIWSAVEVALLS